MQPDGKIHGGVALIRCNIKHYEIGKLQTEYLKAISIVIEDRSGRITISVTYSPSKHIIKKEQYINFFKTLGNRFIAAGDYNAKYMHWESRLILQDPKT